MGMWSRKEPLGSHPRPPHLPALMSSVSLASLTFSRHPQDPAELRVGSFPPPRSVFTVLLSVVLTAFLWTVLNHAGRRTCVSSLTWHLYVYVCMCVCTCVTVNTRVRATLIPSDNVPYLSISTCLWRGKNLFSNKFRAFRKCLLLLVLLWAHTRIDGCLVLVNEGSFVRFDHGRDRYLKRVLLPEAWVFLPLMKKMYLL